MSRLIWDADGQRLYETGVNRGVLYPKASTGSDPYPQGVVWNGLTTVTEKPTGADENKIYADNMKYLSLRAAEEFEATIEAYTYPDEFAFCDGSASIATGVSIGQQRRQAFGLCYNTIIGNDTDNDDHGYKIHIIYGATASPSEKSFQSINDNPEAITFSWDVTTNPVNVTGYKPTANLVIDSTKATASKLAALEKILYGVDAPAFDETKTYAIGDYCTHSTKSYICTTAVTTPGAWSDSNWTETTVAPRLPLPDEIAELFDE